MSKTLDDVKAVLMKDADGIALLESLSGAILHERELAKGMVKETKETLDKVKGSLKELGWEDSVDIVGFTSGLKTHVETAKNSGVKLTESEKRMQTLEKQLAEMSDWKTKAQSAEKSIRDKNLISALEAQFKGKIFSAGVRAKDLVRDGEVDFDADGKTVVFKRGSDIVPLEKGVSEYLAANKDDLVNGQKSGADVGSPGGVTTLGKTMKRADYERLDPDSKQSFFKDKGTLVD